MVGDFSYTVSAAVRSIRFVCAIGWVIGLVLVTPIFADDVLTEIPHPRYRLEGFVGDRIEENATQWLMIAPRENPGLLEMLARRDNGSAPDLVPWAGEFVGKYLISGVQAVRMTENQELFEQLSEVVQRLIELQAEDGYLGPWPKAERLRGHWDLWGHYHVLLALLRWAEQTGDLQAQRVAERIGDLVCDTFLAGPLRVVDAGSPEMNMAIVHGMTQLYRSTGQARYLQMALEVVRDFEQAGDYYRTGLAGREFFRTPRPRWESLHSLQGLADLYRITGDADYRTAFLQHWASIRQWDLRNTGGFSSGEQATGNPFANDAIETCCVIAWQEIMLEALKLTGDSSIADDLELSLYNAALGAQHPSGRWCTYNTPMNGQRIPSHVEIRFQARPDTPDLNCCSVNGPRGYGILSQWAVLRRPDGLAIQYWGPMEARVTLSDGTPVTIRTEGNYPYQEQVQVRIQTEKPCEFTLALRIPNWSSATSIHIANEPIEEVPPGKYCLIPRIWHDEQLTIRFDLAMHYETGDREQAGRIALYRGPILLAADDRFQAIPTPAIAIRDLSSAQVLPPKGARTGTPDSVPPALRVEIPGESATTLQLIDFASAGSTDIEGTPRSHYESWLPADGARPPRPVADRPPNRTRFSAGDVTFSWRKTVSDPKTWHEVVISSDPAGDRVVQRHRTTNPRSITVSSLDISRLETNRPYYWAVLRGNEFGVRTSSPPRKQFVVDPLALPAPSAHDQVRAADGMLTEAQLHGDPKAQYGKLLEAIGWTPSAGRMGEDDGSVELNGRNGRLKYQITAFPEDDYSVGIWVQLREFPTSNYGQIFSAWTAGMDDPLRLVIEGRQLFARIEAHQAYSTNGIALERNRWYHVAAVKHGEQLTLYVDGQPVHATRVPDSIWSGSTEFAIGGNPRFSGPEFLAGRFCDLRFFARALSADEVRQWARSNP